MSTENIKQNISISGDQDKRTLPFSISNYILKSVLPKCVMSNGGIIASVYFQIAFNINNQSKAKSWQKNKCWKSPHKIANEIGCHNRKVKHAIKILVACDLLEESLRGKLKMYKLQNDKIIDEKELSNFLFNIEKKLLFLTEKVKVNSLRKQFSDLNKMIERESPNFLKFMLKRTWIPDLVSLKGFFIEAEQIYKGSSLFFMNVLESNLKNCKKNIDFLNTINNIASLKQPLKYGCSNTTLNRYVAAYQSSALVNLINNKVAELIEQDLLVLNKFEVDNENKRVVKKMSIENLICPICEKDFKNGRSLGMHLGKMTDEAHQKFNQLRKDKKCSHDDLQVLYQENISLFGGVKKQNNISNNVTTSNYMEIPCDCKISCRDCHLNWSDDFYNPCNHKRKQAYMEEYGIKQNKVSTHKKQNESSEKEKKTINHGKDTAPGLLKHFYELTNGRSPNWGKECGQIKSQIKKGLTPEEIRTVMKFMARKGQVDLRFLSTSINDALLEQKFLTDSEQEGNASYLVKYFYESHGLRINLQTFVREVQKVQETINSGLTYEETKFVIDHMIAQKCTVINFIASKVTEAMSKYNAQKSGNSLQTGGFKSNPSFFDQDDLTIIKDELAGARTHINKLDSKYKEKAVEIARNLFKEQNFTTRYTHFEWAWRIGLELDYEMYQMGVKNLEKETYIDFALRNSDQIKPEKLQMLKKLKTSFETWISRQHEKFSGNNITTIK